MICYQYVSIRSLEIPYFYRGIFAGQKPTASQGWQVLRATILLEKLVEMN